MKKTATAHDYHVADKGQSSAVEARTSTGAAKTTPKYKVESAAKYQEPAPKRESAAKYSTGDPENPAPDESP